MEDKDIRFCPYCSLMQFDMAEVEDNVPCEICGVDVPAAELVKAV